MQNIQFDPEDVSVNAGRDVTWTNDEAVPHDVHKSSGPAATSPPAPRAGCTRATRSR